MLPGLDIRQRAAAVDKTRDQIIRAAVAVQAKQGIAETSWASIGAVAHVSTATVYRHFPDEAALFNACSSHWLAANPNPEVDGVSLRETLERLYAYYAQTEGMQASLLRDAESEPQPGGLTSETWATIRSDFESWVRALD